MSWDKTACDPPCVPGTCCLMLWRFPCNTYIVRVSILLVTFFLPRQACPPRWGGFDRNQVGRSVGARLCSGGFCTVGEVRGKRRGSLGKAAQVRVMRGLRWEVWGVRTTHRACFRDRGVVFGTCCWYVLVYQQLSIFRGLLSACSRRTEAVAVRVPIDSARGRSD